MSRAFDVVTLDFSSLLAIIVALARFQIAENPVDGSPARNVNAEEIISVAQNAVLGEVGREGAETLAIARSESLEGYIEERNRIVNKLC